MRTPEGHIVTTTFIWSTDRKTNERYQWRYQPDTLEVDLYGDPKMPSWRTVDTNVTEPLTHIRLLGHTIVSTKDV